MGRPCVSAHTLHASGRLAVGLSSKSIVLNSLAAEHISACRIFHLRFIVQADDFVCKDRPIKFNKIKSIFNKI